MYKTRLPQTEVRGVDWAGRAAVQHGRRPTRATLRVAGEGPRSTDGITNGRLANDGTRPVQDVCELATLPGAPPRRISWLLPSLPTAHTPATESAGEMSRAAPTRQLHCRVAPWRRSEAW